MMQSQWHSRGRLRPGRLRSSILYAVNFVPISWKFWNLQVPSMLYSRTDRKSALWWRKQRKGKDHERLVVRSADKLSCVSTVGSRAKHALTRRRSACLSELQRPEMGENQSRTGQ